MTTHAPNFCPRLKYHYRAAGIDHSVQLRAPAGTTISSVEGVFTTLAYDLFNKLNASLADDFTWLFAEACEEAENIFFPISNPANVTGAVDAGIWSPVKRIRGLTFSGKSAGSKARLTLFGINLNSDADGSSGGDGLLLVGESAPVADIAAELSGIACSGAGVVAHWYNRATIKEFDHLLKAVRRGTIS